LTTRDLEGWLESRRRHVERNLELAAQGRYSGTFLTVDVDTWRLRFVKHHEKVRRTSRTARKTCSSNASR
jgi:hypothetical protein